MDQEEMPLSGGRITAGVIRLGDTVRRPIRGDHACTHSLLTYLEKLGFDGTPRFLGIDEQNREILSYLPGEVKSDLGHFSDAQLSAAAVLLRRFHDATAQFPAVRECNAEVMCHNDWTPTNAVFHDDNPYGMIDFDTVAPGLRVWDLGYAAFAWLDLGNPDYSGDEQVRRLSVFAEAYGLVSCSAVQIAVCAVARQTAPAVSGRVKGNVEMAEWAASAASWTILNVTERICPTGYDLRSAM